MHPSAFLSVNNSRDGWSATTLAYAASPENTHSLAEIELRGRTFHAVRFSRSPKQWAYLERISLLPRNHRRTSVKEGSSKIAT